MPYPIGVTYTGDAALHGPVPLGEPTPAEIAQRCEAIRAGWTAAEHERRIVELCDPVDYSEPINRGKRRRLKTPKD